MVSKENSNEIRNDSIIDVISSERFGDLSDEMQKEVINSISNSGKKEDGGLMGKIFGHKKENAAMNIAFIICILLAIVGVVCMKLENEKWDVIIPAIMTSVGYMFGVGVKNS